MQESDANIALENANGARQGRLRNSDAFSGTREMLLLGNCNKVTEMTKFHSNSEHTKLTDLKGARA